MAYSEFPRSSLISEAIKVKKEYASISQRHHNADLILSTIYPEWVDFIKQRGTITHRGNLGIASWEDREAQAMIGTDEEPITAKAIFSRGRFLLNRYQLVTLKIEGLPRYLEMGYWLGWRASIYDKENPTVDRGQVMGRYPTEDEAVAYTILLADFRKALSSDLQQASAKL